MRVDSEEKWSHQVDGLECFQKITITRKEGGVHRIKVIREAPGVFIIMLYGECDLEELPVSVAACKQRLFRSAEGLAQIIVPLRNGWIRSNQGNGSTEFCNILFPSNLEGIKEFVEFILSIKTDG